MSWSGRIAIEIDGTGKNGWKMLEGMNETIEKEKNEDKEVIRISRQVLVSFALMVR